ncbi:hypothetical protein SAMN05661010_02116 [Modicisalibacter muralis]|uniref:Antitoxin Xre/MbcA/ParS-like toxin-binding domain-containing protein n=1 Tax=Modicisalibacter muralis TaxID=119000 RepID=A0A1G9LKF3_9GAMM|nr:antitoxin Xre/MbcA/ParS toxin-binding domain-containing protein [Halomonas muralis]SDL61965.1 hypothetical protein SAMN05661010_02116 [Halomonas muralis]
MTTVEAPVISKTTAASGLTAAVAILQKWGATGEQGTAILRVSRSTYARAKRRDPGWEVNLDGDQLTRISLVLNMHAALRVIFDNPENHYGFMAMANHNGYFDGRSPLEIIAQGGILSLYEVYRRIDSLRGAQW